MAYYKHEFDPVKSLEGKTKIPKSLLDLPQILAEKQARKLWTRPLQVDSERKDILELFRELYEVNRLHEQLVTIEELCSLFGQVIICLDKYKEEKLPRLSYADPYMLSRIGKFHIQERVASVYKYIIRDTKAYPVLEEWSEKKVKRTWYLPDSSVQVDSMQAPLPELESRKVLEVEEKEHNLGCLPVVELRNKQKWVYELMSPWSWKPQLATWYPVRGMIEFAYHTLRQIWKNMILVKPKIVGDIYAQDMHRFTKAPEDMIEVLGDMFVNLKHGREGTSGSNLQILQGDMQIREWFEGFQQIIDFIFIGCGFSPQNEAAVEKTATEVASKQEASGETISLLRQLRIDQWGRTFDKALIMGGLWDGKGARPYTLSIPDQENKDKTAELEESRIRIDANLSNYVTEISKLYGVNKEEANTILKENIKVNSEVFEATKSMRPEEEGQVEEGKKDDKQTTN